MLARQNLVIASSIKARCTYLWSTTTNDLHMSLQAPITFIKGPLYPNQPSNQHENLTWLISPFGPYKHLSLPIIDTTQSQRPIEQGVCITRQEK